MELWQTRNVKPPSIRALELAVAGKHALVDVKILLLVKTLVCGKRGAVAETLVQVDLLSVVDTPPLVCLGLGCGLLDELSGSLLGGLGGKEDFSI